MLSNILFTGLIGNVFLMTYSSFFEFGLEYRALILGFEIGDSRLGFGLGFCVLFLRFGLRFRV